MRKKFYSVAIDGPSGAGKSTLARRVAERLGFRYVDTGAIYRAVGYHMALMGVGPRDKDGITRFLDDVNIQIVYADDGIQHMILNGHDITDGIRTPEMSVYASGVSALPCVRDYLLDMQRSLARTNNVIMDGRDIGTVVLPQADVKIFLTASAEVRAQRRYAELISRGENVTLDKVLADMHQRDKQDSTRAVAPLRCAEDAVRLDTSEMNLDEAEAAILKIVRGKLG